MLRVRDLAAFYGPSQALFGMELAVDAGEVVTLMGRNGMGKTTTVNAIMGLMPGRSGVVEFEGKRVDHLPSFRIARLGLGLVPEAARSSPISRCARTSWRPRPTACAEPIPGPCGAPSNSSRGWASARGTAAISCRAASSRCWRSAAR